VIGPVAGILFAALLSILSYRLHWLTLAGSFGQFVLGSLLFGVGGWPWAVPIIVFYVSSSLLTIVFKEQRESAEIHYAKSSQRDLVQVLANGGLAGVLILVMAATGSPIAYGAYVASCAAACADTWATEIGTIFPGEPRLIVGFARVERGRSGAVSIAGTLACFAGSVTVGLAGLAWFPGVEHWSWFSVVASAGIAGCVVDSILGATLQGQWRCQKCAKIVEKSTHCSAPANPVSGFKFMTNDLVNFVSIVISALTAWCGILAIRAQP
jgi:uncharacterized protein (TIGR00297 family)